MNHNLSRMKKVKYNVATMGLFVVISTICNMIVPRLIIGSFGSEYNGIISSVTQFVSIISILQAGVSGSTRVALYKVLAKNDTNKISRILEANKRYMRKISFIYGIFVLLLACFYNFVANTSVAWLEMFTLILILGSGTFAQYFFGITYQTLLKADQRNYIYYLSQMVMVILNAIASVVLINLGYSVHIVKFWSAMIYCATPIFLSEYVKHNYKLEKNCTPDNTALEHKGAVMYHTIADIVYENSSILALTLFYNINLVSIFSVYYLVCAGLRKAIRVLTGSLEGGFGDMWAKNEKNTLINRFNTYELLISIIVSILFTSALALITPFVTLYTKNIADINYININFSILILIATTIYCLKIPYMTLIQACGKYKQTQKGIFFEIGMGVACTGLLTFKFELVGAAMGMLITMIIRLAYMSYYVYCNIIEESYIRFIKRSFWLIFTYSGTSIICRYLINLYNINSWISFIFAGVFITITTFAIIIISSFIFYRKDMQGLIKICAGIFKK